MFYKFNVTSKRVIAFVLSCVMLVSVLFGNALLANAEAKRINCNSKDTKPILQLGGLSTSGSYLSGSSISNSKNYEVDTSKVTSLVSSNPQAASGPAITLSPKLFTRAPESSIQFGDPITIHMLSNEKLKSAIISYTYVLNGSESQSESVEMTQISDANGEFTYEGSYTPKQIGEYHIRLIGKEEEGNQSQLPADNTYYTVIVSVKDTGNAPILTCDNDTLTSIEEGNELNIPYSYSDDMGIQKIVIYYKTSSDTEYKSIETTSFRIEGKYFAQIPADELLSQDYVEYYLEAFNLYRSTKTEVKKIKINKLDDFTGIRTNITEGESFAGNVLITAKDKKDRNVSIEIDGTKMKQVNLLEKGAFFTLSFTGNDSYYKNAVSIGDSILTYIAKWSNVMQSKAIFVDQSYFNYREDGSCVITVSLWAGTQGSAFEIGNSSNNDDYKATGFHLVLTDGTVLNPDNGIDPNQVQNMGDSKGMIERLDIHFTVPADKVDALGYVWDTTLENDGLHNIEIKSANDTKNIQVRVDNTAPVITTTIAKNEKINNECQAELEFSDETGINDNTIEVYLNGIILEKPYTFHGSDLVDGTNKLVVKVTDLNGNQAVQTTSFTYNNGKLVVSSMAETGAKKDTIHLKAVLEDSVTNNTKVTFYEGKHYEIGNEITVWQGTGDETGSSKEGALGTVISDNGEYPYQLYEIKADGDPSDILQVKIGATSSYNRPIQLYVYNVSNDNWDILKSYEAEGIYKAEFPLYEHVQNKTVKVLVQARGTETTPTPEQKKSTAGITNYYWDGTKIPDQYDFSFAWITDTQYYTETWPDTFTTMNQWIISQMKDQNIKYVIHTGDLVDEFEQTYQWECVDKNMKYFEEAGLPYGVLAGNHDVAAGNELYENYLKYFGEFRFINSPVYGESYKNNLGHYDLLTIKGQEFIMLYMGWDIYTNEIEWMNKVLQKYNDRKAIICLHRYVNQNGTLDYTGDMVQKQVVAKNANVFAVLNGHYHGSAINITAFDDNYDGVKERTVYQICTDYQSAEKGGTGYVKMLYFDLLNNKIYMNSYSKDLNDFNYFDKSKLSSYDAGVIEKELDIYELSVDFNKSIRSLTTTSMEAALFTSKQIGEVNSLNGIAETDWKGLSKDTQYGWYTSMINSDDILVRGDVNEFVFMPINEQEPTTPTTPTTPSTPTTPTTPTPTPSLPSATIEKAIPVFTVPTGLTVIYGNTLSQITLPTGFSFEDSTSTKVGDVGEHIFKLKYTPSDTTKYLVVSGIEVKITVVKAKQNFEEPTLSSYTKTYGSKSFSLKAKSTGDGNISYTSDNKRVVTINNNGQVTINGCGKANITIKVDESKNYLSAVKVIAIIVRPQKVSLFHVIWSNKNTLKVTWRKDVNVSGYEITYASNSKFTSNTTTINIANKNISSKNINNLIKDNTYYLKVRAYKIIDGKKVYGAYSNVIKVNN